MEQIFALLAPCLASAMKTAEHAKTVFSHLKTTFNCSHAPIKNVLVRYYQTLNVLSHARIPLASPRRLVRKYALLIGLLRLS